MKLDLAFPAQAAAPIAADHGYELFGAVSRALPWLHDAAGTGIHPVRGEQVGNRQLKLLPRRSYVTLRIDEADVGRALPLVGLELAIGSTTVRVASPTVRLLEPRPALRSRLVTIKGMLDASHFIDAVWRQLTAMGCSANVAPTVSRRRTLRIRNREIVGFELILEGLTAHESITVQEKGIGGRRHMGCGVFHGLR